MRPSRPLLLVVAGCSMAPLDAHAPATNTGSLLAAVYANEATTWSGFGAPAAATLPPTPSTSTVAPVKLASLAQTAAAVPLLVTATPAVGTVPPLAAATAPTEATRALEAALAVDPAMQPAWVDPRRRDQPLKVERAGPPSLQPVRLTRLEVPSAEGANSLSLTSASCAPLAEGAVLGLGLGTVSEEFAHVVHSAVRNCSASVEASSARVDVRLDRALRFEHGEGVGAGVMPDRFQIPVKGVALEGLAPAAFEGRARLAAERASDWIETSVSVISSGPDKTALRQTLFTLALALLSATCGCIIFAGATRIGRRLATKSVPPPGGPASKPPQVVLGR